MDFSDTNATVSRRRLLQAGAGAATGAVALQAATPAAAQDAYDGYLSEEGTWDGLTVRGTNRQTVRVHVGTEGNQGFNAFSPVAIVVDPGTTVRWVWADEQGSHNVVHDAENDPDHDSVVFDSREEHEGSATNEAGFEYEHTFEEGDEGTYQYVCTPHRGVNMKGVIVVGEENVETDTAPILTSPQPDLGGYLDDARLFDGVEDFRGLEHVRVSVGAGDDGFAFDPPAIHVDDGTTVVWEWTGEGGDHNVVHTDEQFESEFTGEAGFEFEQTFEEADTAEDNVYNYFCTPHEPQGMKGAVVVGDNYPALDEAVTDLDMSAIWAGAGVFGAVAVIGVAAYNELVNGGEAAGYGAKSDH